MILLTLSLNPQIFFQKKVSSGVSFLFLPVGIATAIGILDEIYQSFIPYRDASIGDIMKDIIGIILAGILISFYQRKRRKRTGICQTGLEKPV